MNFQGSFNILFIVEEIMSNNMKKNIPEVAQYHLHDNEDPGGIAPLTP